MRRYLFLLLLFPLVSHAGQVYSVQFPGCESPGTLGHLKSCIESQTDFKVISAGNGIIRGQNPYGTNYWRYYPASCPDGQVLGVGGSCRTPYCNSPEGEQALKQQIESCYSGVPDGSKADQNFYCSNEGQVILGSCTYTPLNGGEPNPGGEDDPNSVGDDGNINPGGDIPNPGGDPATGGGSSGGSSSGGTGSGSSGGGSPDPNGGQSGSGGDGNTSNPTNPTTPTNPTNPGGNHSGGDTGSGGNLNPGSGSGSSGNSGGGSSNPNPVEPVKVDLSGVVRAIKNLNTDNNKDFAETKNKQQTIINEINEFDHNFGVGIAALDKRVEENKNALNEISELTKNFGDENQLDLDAIRENTMSQLEKAFAQFDESQKQTELLGTIDDHQDKTNEKLDKLVKSDNESNEKLDKLVESDKERNEKLDALNNTLQANDEKQAERDQQIIDKLSIAPKPDNSLMRELHEWERVNHGDMEDVKDGLQGVEDAINEQTDELLDHGLTEGDVRGDASKATGIITGEMDGVLDEFKGQIESVADGLPTNADAFADVSKFYSGLVGVSSSCTPLVFGELKISCEVSARFKEIFGFIIYVLTALTLIDIMFTGIVPDPRKQGL